MSFSKSFPKVFSRRRRAKWRALVMSGKVLPALALGLLVASAPTAYPRATPSHPETFKVVGGAGETLPIRARPGDDGAVIAMLPAEVDGVLNLGCVETESGKTVGRARWCRVGFERTIGWVAARFLIEGSATDNFGGGRRLAAITGTQWQLRDFAGQSVASEAWIVFGIDERVVGFGGCNRFSGAFTELPGKLNFGRLVWTGRRCSGGLRKIEQQLADALLTTASAVATGELLTLFAHDSSVLATFTRRWPQ